MAEYDFQKAKKLIQLNSDLIESAHLGMAEDWFWTAETVFEDGKFTIDLEEDGLLIAGIKSSIWATPVIELRMKDGREVVKNCYAGDIGGEAPEWFSLGVLSQQCQDVRDGKFIENK